MFLSRLHPVQRFGLPRSSLLLVVLAVLAGCATTQNVQQVDRLESVKENPRVVLMPPDIRYYLLTAGGTPVVFYGEELGQRDTRGSARTDLPGPSGPAVAPMWRGSPG